MQSGISEFDRVAGGGLVPGIGNLNWRRSGHW
jgi:predicted ATP-dependent serine protease